MKDKKIIRWGIIGVGDVCEVKSGPAIYKAEASHLLAVMRRDLNKAEDFARRHQVPLAYGDAAELLSNPDIDAVYIATPPAYHKDYAVAALAAGKYVYIEKPVALNAAECDVIIAALKTAKTKVSVAHYRRHLPCFLKFAELINTGAIGRPLMVSLEMLQPAASKIITETADNWRVIPALSGGGLFHDLSPHQLDLMLQWFGNVNEASGMAVNQRQLNAADDCVLGWARFSSGVVLQGRWHYAVNEQQTRDLCEVIGTEGKLSINFFGQQVIKIAKCARGTGVYYSKSAPHTAAND